LDNPQHLLSEVTIFWAKKLELKTKVHHLILQDSLNRRSWLGLGVKGGDWDDTKN
jgi:hypothetical protein